MNILYVNHYAGSLRHGMEYRPFYLAREWVRLGHRVRIVAASRSHLRTSEPDCDRPLRHERIDGIEYAWVRTPGYHGNGPGRIRNMLAFLGGLYRRSEALTRDFQPDVVIASSTYPLDTLPCARIARRSGARLVFELHDLWPLSPMELGSMPRWHPFIATMQFGENYACRNVDAVVSMLPKAEEHLRTHGLATGKFHYVPNGIDVEGWNESVEPLSREVKEALDGLRANGAFLVGYAGAHGLANALDYFVEAASLTRSEPIAYVLVGQGPEKARLQERASALQLQSLHFLPPVPKSQVPALLAAMDALFIGWQHKAIYRFGISPNKLMDYLMAARPIVHSVEAGNDVVAESGAGISVAPENAAEIAAAVRQLAASTPEQRSEMGARGRRYVLERHDYRVLAKDFLQAIA